MTSDLEALNARWRTTGLPYAQESDSGGYRVVCPQGCPTLEYDQPLAGAMSDALAHKSHCPR